MTSDDLRALTALGRRPDDEPLPRIQVRLIDVDEQGRRLQPAALLWLGSLALAMTPALKSRIEPVVRADGRFVELACDDGEFWMFVPQVRDVLDEARSHIVRFAEGNVMYVERYAFKGAEIAEATAFRIPQVPNGPMFCVRQLVEALASEQGVRFAEVWRSGPD
ncbi:hypothetical protein AB0J72_27920 [Dactylosporangium sp. NPDC049742]|uniref:hypothetical protein n=1 Tax=Dactylosporangium sp. NPDC049742 TaxID=3154737 RepID=UPI00343064C5